MKKVLVLMATYNGARYLDEQIQSLIDQKNVELEILVRDDGSTDNTINVLNKWKKQGKLDWYTGKHLNVQYGFYDLMEHAAQKDTEYIAFCDQDYVWDNDKLCIAVEELEDKCSQSNPALYYCGQRLVDEHMNFLSDHSLNEYRNLRTRFVLSDIAGCTAVFNTELLNKVLEYKPEYMLMHDTWVLKVCLAMGGEVIVDPKPHMNYRQHSNNTVGLGKGIKSNLKQVRQYIEEYKVEEQMLELKKGYGKSIIPEYKRVIYYICNYKNNIKCRKKLLSKHYINFCNKGLNLTYFIKIMLNKL